MTTKKSKGATAAQLARIDRALANDTDPFPGPDHWDGADYWDRWHNSEPRGVAAAMPYGYDDYGNTTRPMIQGLDDHEEWATLAVSQYLNGKTALDAESVLGAVSAYTDACPTSSGFRQIHRTLDATRKEYDEGTIRWATLKERLAELPSTTDETTAVPSPPLINGSPVQPMIADEIVTWTGLWETLSTSSTQTEWSLTWVVE